MYINEINNNNMTYSIDMIRLKTYIDYSLFTEIEFRFNTCWRDFIKKQWTTPKLQEFFYNYNIEIGEGLTFWFGFLHNTERRSLNEHSHYNFTIEFNPNKLKNNEIVMYLLSISGKWFIKSFDLAVDLKINILDLIPDYKNRRNYKFDIHGFDDRTIYIGKGDGRVKIYNKKKESNLNISHDLTRIEISRYLDDFPISDIKNFLYADMFPCIYLNKYLYTFKDYEDKTLFALLYAVQSGFPLKDLSRAYREKIRNLFEAGYKIKFSNISAYQTLYKTIMFYFISNNKVRWK